LEGLVPYHNDSGNNYMVIRRSIVITLLSTIVGLMLSACAGPLGLAYSTASGTALVTTGKSIPEHGASKLTDADCSVWNAVVEFAYICEYNKNPAVTYNRNAF